MTRYRLTLFDRPLAPWRATRADVLQDAIRLGKAAWDASAREHYIAVPFDTMADALGTEVEPLPEDLAGGA